MKVPKLQFSLLTLFRVLTFAPLLVALFAYDDWLLWELSLELLDVSLWQSLIRATSLRLMEDWSLLLLFVASWLATMAIFELGPVLHWLSNPKNKG